MTKLAPHRKDALTSLGISMTILLLMGGLLGFIIIPGFQSESHNLVVTTIASAPRPETQKTTIRLSQHSATAAPHPQVRPSLKPLLTPPQSDLNIPTIQELLQKSDSALEQIAIHQQQQQIHQKSLSQNEPTPTPAKTEIAAASATTPAPDEQKSRCPVIRKVKEYIARQPQIRKRIPPTYPPLAKQTGQEGALRIAATVTTKGTIERASIAASSGHPQLDSAALAAVRHWLFHPAQTNTGRYVTCQTIIPITFRLR